MLKLYKNFYKRDWIGVITIICLTILQVYLTMTIVDYIQGIIKAITLVNYHNNPAALGQQALDFFNYVGGWDNINSDLFEKLQDVIPGNNLSKETLDQFIAIKNASTADIWYNGGMMVLLAILLMLVQAVISVVASFVAADLSTNIRRSVYNKIEELSIAEVNKFSTPSLVTRTTNDIQNVQMANLITMRMVFAAPITAIWAIIKIQASSAELTIATSIAIVALLAFIITLLIVAMPKFKIMQKLTDSLNGVTRENLTGIRIIRAFNAEEYQEKKFTKANDNFTKANIFTGKVMSLMSPVMMLIMNGISLAIYWIGADLINKNVIDYPTVTSFMTLSSQIIMSFVMLMMLFILWPRASVSAARINEILDEEPSINNPEVAIKMNSIGTIEFNNVSFKYPDSEEYALKNISFKANKGETVAIIGATGSGKTTLVNLIPRLYEATEGEVLVNGAVVTKVYQKDLRDTIGYVPQAGFLFKGTVKENMMLGNDNLTDNELDEALRVADAYDFVYKKDEKTDFVISQRGKNVSGGQRQRLCIARAVAKNPSIYIFDDSFSALDYKTDKLVRENLMKHNIKATKVIVAQRIGTILDADKIIVLDDGKIVGMGTHENLLKSCEVYLEIALSQLSKEELGL